MVGVSAEWFCFYAEAFLGGSADRVGIHVEAIIGGDKKGVYGRETERGYLSSLFDIWLALVQARFASMLWRFLAALQTGFTRMLRRFLAGT